MGQLEDDKSKAGVEKQDSKKGFKKNEHVCSVEKIFKALDSTASQYLKAVKAGLPDLDNGLSFKLQHFLN